jgi:hypothetical protein
MKNPKDPIGNRIRDLPACSVVPHPAALTPTILLRGSNRHCSSITVFLPEHTSRYSTLLRFLPLEDLARLKNKQFLIPDTFRLCLNHIRKTHDRLYISLQGLTITVNTGCGASEVTSYLMPWDIAGPSCLRRS